MYFVAHSVLDQVLFGSVSGRKNPFVVHSVLDQFLCGSNPFVAQPMINYSQVLCGSISGRSSPSQSLKINVFMSQVAFDKVL